MGDAELDAIRQQRMQQMQMQQQEQQQEQMEGQINSMLGAVLTQEARGRLNTVKLTKPDVAKRVEMRIVQMAQGGQLQGKVSDDQMVRLLGQAAPAKKTTISFNRRAALDSDSDSD